MACRHKNGTIIETYASPMYFAVTDGVVASNGEAAGGEDITSVTFKCASCGRIFNVEDKRSTPKWMKKLYYAYHHKDEDQGE